VLDALAERAAGQMGAENFPVALRFLPRGPRRDLTSVYRYARFVDDVGDEAPGGPADRLALLDQVETDLRSLEATGQARLAPVAGLAPLVRTGRVPVQPFADLVEANRVDQRTTSYETFDDLLGYCRLSANPVGRVVLHVAGAATTHNLADSDSVCSALQVLEHCQDVGEDARNGRVYLPAADLHADGVGTDELTGAAASDALRRVVAREVERSREMLAAGRPLVRRLSGWARLAVAGYVAGGLATADALDAARYDVLGHAVRPSRVRTARYVLRLLGSAW
jgi:squalene synthase HpnC